MKHAGQSHADARRMQPVSDMLADALLNAAMGQVAQLIDLPLNGKIIGFLRRVYERVTQDPRTPRYAPAYEMFSIPKRKKPGEFRRITAPNKALKWVQQKILHSLLEKHYTPLPLCHANAPRSFDAAQGLTFPRTMVSNAWYHLGVPPGVNPRDELEAEEIRWRKPQALFSVDVKNAFPSVTEDDVFEVFEDITGDPLLASVLMRLCTWDGCLPQGAPTSPLLLNFVFRQIDEALYQEFNSSKRRLRVTRYVDDIAVTSTYPGISAHDRKKLQEIMGDHGFPINADKTCYWHRFRHVLRITGINIYPEYINVVYAKPAWDALALPPRMVEQFRTLLHGLGYELRGLETEIRACVDELREKADKKIESEIVSLKKHRMSPFRRMLGILSFCHMVYGDAIPPRIYRGCLMLKQGRVFEDLVWIVKRMAFDAEMYNEMYDIYQSGNV